MALALVAVVGAADDVPARRTALLIELGRCRSALPKDAQYAVSPCAEKAVAVLAGASKEEVLSKLGNPSFCILTTGEVKLSGDALCSTALSFGYSFYILKGVGGGPELILNFGKDQVVQAASWMHTQ